MSNSPERESRSASPNPHEAVVTEIISSERNYIHEIRTFLEVFVRPLQLQMKKEPILTSEEFATIECNIEAVFSLSKSLVWELDKRYKEPGQIFAEEAESMRVAYVKFVTMYMNAFTLHVRLMKEKSKRKNTTQNYAQFINDAAERQKQRVRGRSPIDFLILPVQRVPRYRLLLIELWKKLTPGLDRDWVKEAVLRVSAVATEMNRSLSLATSRRKLLRQESTKAKLTEEKQGDAPHQKNTEEEDIFAEEDQFIENMESISMTLYRTRNPTLFNLDATTTGGRDIGDGEDVEAKEDAIPMTREEEMEHLCLTKGWINPRHYPTGNPFVLFHVVTRSDPFLSVRIEDPEQKEKQSTRRKYRTPPKLPSAIQLTMHLIKGIYSPSTTPRPFHPRLRDIIVAGPIRSGQTPVLHILESLRSGGVVPLTSLLDRVTWLESDDWDQRLDMFSSLGRLVKTHAKLNQAFGGVLVPTPRGEVPEFRVIVVLRDPADLRLSLYRHCRRLYRKCQRVDPDGKKMLSFDALATVDDFASCLPAYESFVADALKVAVQMESPQIKIVFYEQVLSQPKRVILDLAEFCGLLPVQKDPSILMDEISYSLKGQVEFPHALRADHRIGCTSQGRAKFHAASMAKMNENWTANVTSGFPQFSSYSALYLHFTKTALPGIGQLPSMAAAVSNSPSLGSKSSFIRLGKQVIGPISRLAKSSGSFVLNGGSSQGAASQQDGMSRGSAQDQTVFETMAQGGEVKAEELTSTPRSSSFVALPLKSSFILAARGTKGGYHKPRGTHLGVNTALSREKAIAVMSKRISDTLTTKSDLTASSNETSKSGDSGPQVRLDPDDSDDEIMDAQIVKPVVPNIVGDRM